MTLNVFPLLTNLLPKVLNLIPKVGESFEDALARVCRCIGGGIGATNEDSDSDLQVIAEAITVNLRCPVSNDLSFLYFCSSMYLADAVKFH